MKITKNSKDSQWGIHGAFAVEDSQINHLLGELLTVIDALGLKENQEKSVKDIIKQKVWSSFSGEDYIDGKIIVLAKDLKWQLRDEDNKRYFSQEKENREKGLHDRPLAMQGDYILTFISEDDKPIQK